jgi:hypothetical protein
MEGKGVSVLQRGRRGVYVRLTSTVPTPFPCTIGYVHVCSYCVHPALAYMQLVARPFQPLDHKIYNSNTNSSLPRKNKTSSISHQHRFNHWITYCFRTCCTRADSSEPPAVEELRNGFIIQSPCTYCGLWIAAPPYILPPCVRIHSS